MKRTLALLCVVLTLVTLLATTALADTGPKPSIRITFSGLEGQRYYVTLLAEESSYGPHRAGVNQRPSDEASRQIFDAFRAYEDEDGYHFWQSFWDCSESHYYSWNYYPPKHFKILLWFPESETYAVSGPCNRYAFETYYHVDASDWEPGQLLPREKNYPVMKETTKFLIRVLLTVFAEIFIALIFDIRGWKRLLLMVGVNLLTQIGLNFALNELSRAVFVGYVLYTLLEVLVALAEWLLYRLTLPRLSGKPLTHGRVAAYTFTANGVSFVAGILLAQVLPSAF